MVDNLKECPFCGPNKYEPYINVENGIFKVHCGSCEATAPDSEHRATAIAYWNTRPEHPLPLLPKNVIVHKGAALQYDIDDDKWRIFPAQDIVQTAIEAVYGKSKVETIIMNRIKPVADTVGLDTQQLADVLNVSLEIAHNWYIGAAQAPAAYENKLLEKYADKLLSCQRPSGCSNLQGFGRLIV